MPATKVRVTDELCAFLEKPKGTRMNKSCVYNEIYRYVHKNNLVDKGTKRIYLDDVLKKLFECDEFEENITITTMKDLMPQFYPEDICFQIYKIECDVTNLRWYGYIRIRESRSQKLEEHKRCADTDGDYIIALMENPKIRLVEIADKCDYEEHLQWWIDNTECLNKKYGEYDTKKYLDDKKKELMIAKN